MKLLPVGLAAMVTLSCPGGWDDIGKMGFQYLRLKSMTEQMTSKGDIPPQVVATIGKHEYDEMAAKSGCITNQPPFTPEVMPKPEAPSVEEIQPR